MKHAAIFLSLSFLAGCSYLPPAEFRAPASAAAPRIAVPDETRDGWQNARTSDDYLKSLAKKAGDVYWGTDDDGYGCSITIGELQTVAFNDSPSSFVLFVKLTHAGSLTSETSRTVHVFDSALKLPNGRLAAYLVNTGEYDPTLDHAKTLSGLWESLDVMPREGHLLMDGIKPVQLQYDNARTHAPILTCSFR